MYSRYKPSLWCIIGKDLFSFRRLILSQKIVFFTVQKLFSFIRSPLLFFSPNNCPTDILLRKLFLALIYTSLFPTSSFIWFRISERGSPWIFGIVLYTVIGIYLYFSNWSFLPRVSPFDKDAVFFLTVCFGHF